MAIQKQLLIEKQVHAAAQFLLLLQNVHDGTIKFGFGGIHCIYSENGTLQEPCSLSQTHAFFINASPIRGEGRFALMFTYIVMKYKCLEGKEFEDSPCTL